MSDLTVRVQQHPQTHPELRSGEIFLLNIPEHALPSYQNLIPNFLKSVRLGNVAYYTNSDEVVPEYRPLFGVKQDSSPVP